MTTEANNNDASEAIGCVTGFFKICGGIAGAILIIIELYLVFSIF